MLKKLVLDVEKESLKTSNTNLMNKDLIEVKVEPYDLHDSIVNVSKHSKMISSNSKLLQNIDKCVNLINGKLFLNFNSLIKVRCFYI